MKSIPNLRMQDAEATGTALGKCGANQCTSKDRTWLFLNLYTKMFDY